MDGPDHPSQNKTACRSKPYLIPHFLPEISARLYERKRRPLRRRRAAEAWRRAGSVRRRSLLRTNAVCFLVERWRPRCTRMHRRSTSRRRAPAQSLVVTAASKRTERWLRASIREAIGQAHHSGRRPEGRRPSCHGEYARWPATTTQVPVPLPLKYIYI